MKVIILLFQFLISATILYFVREVTSVFSVIHIIILLLISVTNVYFYKNVVKSLKNIKNTHHEEELTK